MKLNKKQYEIILRMVYEHWEEDIYNQELWDIVETIREILRYWSD